MSKGTYYIAPPSHWPLVGSVGLTTTVTGGIGCLHGDAYGPYALALGALILICLMFGWFGEVIRESQSGLHNAQMNRTYRISMAWFIFSEVMFFACFFGALFYTRMLSVPWLSGDGYPSAEMTHALLWPNFLLQWPLLANPDPTTFAAPKAVIPAWGIPALNTAILLSSGGTITWAHWAIQKNKRGQLLLGLGITILLGVCFLCFQAHEYKEAYQELGLTLGSGIYGSTFFMLTGFHGLHVTIGTIILTVIWFRCLKGHFRPDHHFAFEAGAWYWHFVDVVWLFLFIFVYWL